jgi:hypothetical protein
VPGPPPAAEPARGVADRHVGVEHHPVDAVIRALQEGFVPPGQLVLRPHFRLLSPKGPRRWLYAPCTMVAPPRPRHRGLARLGRLSRARLAGRAARSPWWASAARHAMVGQGALPTGERSGPVARAGARQPLTDERGWYEEVAPWRPPRRGRGRHFIPPARHLPPSRPARPTSPARHGGRGRFAQRTFSGGRTTHGYQLPRRGPRSRAKSRGRRSYFPVKFSGQKTW